MKAVITGGCGHIGTYLVPMLVRAGYSVVNVTRGTSRPYEESVYFREVDAVTLDRSALTDGEFEQKIAAMKPDIVIDLIAFEPESVRRMVSALQGSNISHYLFCSTVWTHGVATTLPATEDMPRFPIDDYGRKKLEGELYLHEQHRLYGFPETSVLPGHISGPYWNIINPVGNLDVTVFQKIADGEEITLPNFGLETLHHVHAEDVAQVFMRAIEHRNRAIGESFHAVSAEAITLAAYAKAMYRWFGKEPAIRFVPWEEWRGYTNNQDYLEASYLHIARSGYYSIEKAKRLINYAPKHTILETLEESVSGMVKRGELQI